MSTSWLCHGFAPVGSARLAAAIGLGCSLALAGMGCGGTSTTRAGKLTSSPAKSAPEGSYRLDLFKAEPRQGTAVVILVDTSGSMEQAVPDRGGQSRAKYLIARDALANIVQNTAEWKKAHATANLQLAVYNFSSVVTEVLPMSEFDEGKARKIMRLHFVREEVISA